MIAKLKVMWSEVPSKVQGGIIAFASACAGVMIHHYSDATAWSLADFRHEFITALAAGIGALRVFFMVPNTPEAPKP